MRKLLGVMIIGLMFIGCGLPTYAVKSAMTKDIAKCDAIVIGTTTRAEVENILNEKPISVKILPEDNGVQLTLVTYKSGYFKANVAYSKDNTVTAYECSKE